MPIALIIQKDLWYYRVTKGVGGRRIQRYVRIRTKTEAGKARAMKEAVKIQELLEQQSLAARRLRYLKLDALVKPDGRIKYIHRMIASNPFSMDCFQVYFKDPRPGEPKLRSFAVKKFGEYEAFEKAVLCFAKDKGLDVKGETVKALLGQGWAYGVGDRKQLSQATEAEPVLQSDHDWGGLESEMANFMQKRAQEREDALKQHRSRRRKGQ